MRESVGRLFYYAGAALIIGAIFAPIVIDFGREHGYLGLSAIFTPGRLPEIKSEFLHVFHRSYDSFVSVLSSLSSV